MEPSELRELTATKLQRITWLSSRDQSKCFNNLMHLFNGESLEDCYRELARNKAPGIDQVSKEEYGKQLIANLDELVNKLKRMSYRPGHLREVKIPKEGRPGAVRALAISNFEDKLIQKMMHKVLESIYEPTFLDCSYGFRPGRGCHDAVRALRHYLYENEVETIIDVDLANYFGTIKREILLEILSKRIADKKLLRYIVRLLKSGILSEGELKVTEEGVCQGSACSPILANIFAHYVIDKWFQGVVKRSCLGKVELFRYADDIIICCRYASDAKRIRKALVGRLMKYGLKLNEDKTRMVNFSKKSYETGAKPEGFDFLGFTLYWGRSRSGRAIPKLKSSGKRLRVKLKRVNLWAKKIRDVCKLKDIWKLFCLKLAGHIRYFGVSFNTQGVKRFVCEAVRILFRWLNRRSQKKSFTWEEFMLFMNNYPVPKARIWHKLY